MSSFCSFAYCALQQGVAAVPGQLHGFRDLFPVVLQLCDAGECQGRLDLATRTFLFVAVVPEVDAADGLLQSLDDGLHQNLHHLPCIGGAPAPLERLVGNGFVKDRRLPAHTGLALLAALRSIPERVFQLPGQLLPLALVASINCSTFSDRLLPEPWVCQTTPLSSSALSN